MRSERLTFRVTPRSVRPHLAVPLTYQLFPAGQAGPRTVRGEEYLPETTRLTIPQVDPATLPLKPGAPLKVLIFIPTYDSIDYIYERIGGAMAQGATFPANWSFEIMVVANGRGQSALWQHLKYLKTQRGLGNRLAAAYLPAEENPGMLQSKTTPMNIALDYAHERRFDVFVGLDDDINFTGGNLAALILQMQVLTADHQVPVMVGPEVRFAPPRTSLEKFLAWSEWRSRMVKGCAMLGWTAAFPRIPVDAGNEDLLLCRLYGRNSVIIPEVQCNYRMAATLRRLIRQFSRMKWNDALASRYLQPGTNVRTGLVAHLRRFYPNLSMFSKQGISMLFFASISLFSYLQVQASILFRNIFNLPKSEVNWVGTVDPTTKHPH